MTTFHLHSHSAEETQQIASAVASLLTAGDSVGLVGDLGAGKTLAAKAMAAGLGVTEPVTSPTFTIVQEYDGREHVAHVDTYRLDHESELVDIGFLEMVDSGAVVIVEWADRFEALLPPDRLMISIAAGLGDDDRLVTIETYGAGWEQRTAALRSAISELDLTPDPHDHGSDG